MGELLDKFNRIAKGLEGWNMETHDRKIVCPYCKHQHLDIHECGPGDGETEEMQCDGCGETFDVTLSIEYNYTTETKKKLNED